jgi:demethylmenaquinone methyltransferase/2-methoxy-6-polyprenyl-1,4-benzoquinol methylase
MSQAVHQMFAAIARHYDSLNSILSLGLHHRWRRYAVAQANLHPGASVLDLCSGTADLAFAFANQLGHSSQVVATDFCDAMLSYGIRKAKQRHTALAFALADAQQLPFPNAAFDCVAVAFGLRNVDCLATALREMRRVLKPGGVTVVLEFGQPHGLILAPLYRFYARYLMPCIGGFVSGDRAAYTYLPTTAAVFPAGEKFLHKMAEQSFCKVSAQPLMGGIVYLYTATRST